MRRLVLVPLAAALMLAAGTAFAADTSIPSPAVKTAEQLRDKALDDGTAYAVLQSLTTEVGPRMAGSSSDQRARDWAVAKFKALGFDKVYTEPATYPLWERRSESGSIVAPFPQHLVLTALGYSPGTPKGGLTAPVIAFDSLAALKSADPATIKGKIVYIGFRMQRSRDGHDYGMGSSIRENGPAIAAGKGAVGFILRSAGTDAHERIAHTGLTGFGHPGEGVPAAALSNPDADQLERELAYGKPVTVRLDLDCGIVGQYTGANVIGEITGAKYPDQVVAIGGHLDSWDPGTGAIDDGTGIAISMAAAKLIRDLPQRPDRTIRVIAFANEEMGLWGANAYAEKHAKEATNFMLGTDSDLGAGKVYRMSASVKPQARHAIEQIAGVLKPLGVAYDAQRAGGGGSDLSAMHAKGMAALTLDQDATYYFDWHHTSNDTLDKVDPKELAQNVAAYAAWSYMAAEADGDFGSAPGAFKGDGAED
ncbi:M20/M25/M40 family metallo-hydrolase [Rhodanobacter sp. DHG33]|uniref:M20/M25/M40 family metallo-hydrolase n=1 Tax=Rhodanobacter sp. DHG33 TaxID=2775921 RepID=UPI00178195B6|nr:M20/M25/M40 family metallo-hydrolase [Rhodanobacter sp. DHG33]MBD8897457.1 M20/M25/M40 family metallo-hydrolase [Rhodanobacter sp. DHG33]